MRARLLEILKRPAVAGTGAAFVLRGLTLASRFLLTLLLARMLSPAEMGEYGLLTAALAFALLAIGLEFYSYTLREMVPATPARRTRIIADQMTLAVIALLVIAAAMSGAILADLFPARLGPWFLLILVTEHLSLEATRILIITGRPVRAYIGVFLRGGIWVYAMAILMFTTPSLRNLETVLVWWALGGVLAIASSAFSLRELPWRELKGYRPDWTAILAGLRTARPFMLTAAGALVISYLDRLIIDRIVGREALGVYTFYSTISIGLLSLGASVSHQFLPKVIAGYAAGADAYKKALRHFFWSLLALALGVTISSGLLMWPAVSLLGLAAYEPGIWVFYVMLPGIFMRILADVPSYALYAARSDNYLLLCNLGAAAISTVLNILLIPVFGILGAALASGASSAVLLASLTLLARSKMRTDRLEGVRTAPIGTPPDPDVLYP